MCVLTRFWAKKRPSTDDSQRESLTGSVMVCNSSKLRHIFGNLTLVLFFITTFKSSRDEESSLFLITWGIITCSFWFPDSHILYKYFTVFCLKSINLIKNVFILDSAAEIKRHFSYLLRKKGNSFTKANLVQIKQNSSRKIIYQLILIMKKEGKMMEMHIFGSVTALARVHQIISWQ